MYKLFIKFKTADDTRLRRRTITGPTRTDVAELVAEFVKDTPKLVGVRIPSAALVGFKDHDYGGWAFVDPDGVYRVEGRLAAARLLETVYQNALVNAAEAR